MRGRQIRLLFWGDQAEALESQIYRQVVHILRPRVTLSNPQYINPAEDLMNIELSVQRHTTVNIRGPYDEQVQVVRPNHQTVALRDVGRAEGLVRVEGFIRMRIEQQFVNNAGIGSGALPDGEYRLRVNVSLFEAQQSPPIGTHVAIEGELRRTNQNVQFLQVTDMASIYTLDDQVLDDAALRNGFRIPPSAENIVHGRLDAPQNRIPAVVRPMNPARAHLDEHRLRPANAVPEIPQNEQPRQPLPPSGENSIQIPPSARNNAVSLGQLIPQGHASINGPPLDLAAKVASLLDLVRNNGDAHHSLQHASDANVPSVLDDLINRIRRNSDQNSPVAGAAGPSSALQYSNTSVVAVPPQTLTGVERSVVPLLPFDPHVRNGVEIVNATTPARSIIMEQEESSQPVTNTNRSEGAQGSVMEGGQSAKAKRLSIRRPFFISDDSDDDSSPSVQAFPRNEDNQVSTEPLSPMH